MTGVEWLHPDFELLKQQGAEPELAILSNLLAAFGPLPQELVTHVDDDEAGEVLRLLWEQVEENRMTVPDKTLPSFSEWTAEVFPNLDDEVKRVVAGMTVLDPGRRASMADVVQDRFFE